MNMPWQTGLHIDLQLCADFANRALALRARLHEDMRSSDPGRLAEVVADLNRYVPVQIRVNDNALRKSRITLRLRLADQEAMLEALSEVLPLRWKSLSDNLILIQPAI